MAENPNYMENLWLKEYDANGNDKLDYDEAITFFDTTDPEIIRSVFNDRETYKAEYEAISKDLKDILITVKTFDINDPSKVILLQIIWNIEAGYTGEMNGQWNYETEAFVWEVFNAWEVEITWLEPQREITAWLKINKVIHNLEWENRTAELLDKELFDGYLRLKQFWNTEPLENYFSEKWLENPNDSIQDLDDFLHSSQGLKLYDYSLRYGGVEELMMELWANEADKKQVEKMFDVADTIRQSWEKIVQKFAVDDNELRQIIEKNSQKNWWNSDKLLYCHASYAEWVRETAFRNKVKQEVKELARVVWLKLLEVKALQKWDSLSKQADLWDWNTAFSLDFSKVKWENLDQMKASFESNFDEIFRESFSEEMIDWIMWGIEYALENPVDAGITIGSIIGSWAFVMWVSGSTWWIWWVLLAWTAFTAGDNWLRFLWHGTKEVAENFSDIKSWPEFWRTFWKWGLKWVWFEEWKYWDFAFEKGGELLSNTVLFWIFKGSEEVIKLFWVEWFSKLTVEGVKIPAESLFFTWYNILAWSGINSLKGLSIGDYNDTEAMFRFQENLSKMSETDNFFKSFTINLGLIVAIKWLVWGGRFLLNRNAEKTFEKEFLDNCDKFETELAKLTKEWYNLSKLNDVIVLRDKKWDIVELDNPDLKPIIELMPKVYELAFKAERQNPEIILREKADKKEVKAKNEKKSWNNWAIRNDRLQDVLKWNIEDVMSWFEASRSWIKTQFNALLKEKLPKAELQSKAEKLIYEEITLELARLESKGIEVKWNEQTKFIEEFRSERVAEFNKLLEFREANSKIPDKIEMNFNGRKWTLELKNVEAINEAFSKKEKTTKESNTKF